MLTPSEVRDRSFNRRARADPRLALLDRNNGDSYSSSMAVSTPRLPVQLDPLIGEARQRARRRRLALAAAFLLVAGAVVAFALKATAESSVPKPHLVMTPASQRALANSTGCTPGPRPAIGKFPGDKNGDGKITDSGNERIPALVAAVGDSGVAGYVKATDVFCDPAPVSPAAALASEGKPRQIPLYAANGTTRVGTFTIGSGTG